MKKVLICLLVGLFAVSAFAAPKAKTSKKEEAKPVIEFTIIESEKYTAGKQDPQLTFGIAGFLGGEAKVETVSYSQAKANASLANLDMSFLPLYLIKKTPQLREKLAQHLAAGYVQENDDYLIFPHATRTGVYEEKTAKPNVLEIFVMSQCPYGAMAENLVIEAQKAGKVPADKTVQLRYIVNYDEKNGFQSLHGSAEWEENIRQLLIAKYYPAKLWKYLEIRNKDYRSSRWDKAMEEAGINVNKIIKKFDKEGVELLKAEAAYSNEYGINASPSFLWEGKEVLDFGSVSQKAGLEFLNPNRTQGKGQAVPAGSC
ncbi:MAG: hypothetical protein IKL48_06230 [Elusimicrobiaceae bacterium]|nr:hypothetical protein [Elusimicrobiaceae bacterium]